MSSNDPDPDTLLLAIPLRSPTDLAFSVDRPLASLARTHAISESLRRLLADRVHARLREGGVLTLDREAYVVEVVPVLSEVAGPPAGPTNRASSKSNAKGKVNSNSDTDAHLASLTVPDFIARGGVYEFRVRQKGAGEEVSTPPARAPCPASLRSLATDTDPQPTEPNLPPPSMHAHLAQLRKEVSVMRALVNRMHRGEGTDVATVLQRVGDIEYRLAAVETAQTTHIANLEAALARESSARASLESRLAGIERREKQRESRDASVAAELRDLRTRQGVVVRQVERVGRVLARFGRGLVGVGWEMGGDGGVGGEAPVVESTRDHEPMSIRASDNDVASPRTSDRVPGV
ncbi:hypothetical protein M427DRAFT_132608 [Gonapodya prolifera JEL478]|uniref:Uncharacterized protein n=1 Tax=Gonapodya prolifera (strain JEL478) TaxID=1344416 RepID=A0A139APL2_GONPJ|nr:hypothetical protein M427DRAFT_132608 [Gonapodya prolifera JEL478]|eukprot:KXS18676.1 hypothetical protein M427DRAFT_132608 [Gonapodya prolifera JEL478]